MEQISKVRILVITGATALTAWLGNLAIPTYLLFACSILDYFTALRAAKFRGEKIDSKKGIRGIEKKVFIFILVIVGWLIDQLMIYCVQGFGYTFPLQQPVAIAVCLWLIVNELISILENIKDIVGDRAPKFLKPILERVKSKIEQETTLPEEPPNQ